MYKRQDQEEEDNTTLFIIDVPMIEKNEESDMYTTMPVSYTHLDVYKRQEIFCTRII